MRKFENAKIEGKPSAV